MDMMAYSRLIILQIVTVTSLIGLQVVWKIEAATLGEQEEKNSRNSLLPHRFSCNLPGAKGCLIEEERRHQAPRMFLEGRRMQQALAHLPAAMPEHIDATSQCVISSLSLADFHRQISENSHSHCVTPSCLPLLSLPFAASLQCLPPPARLLLVI